VPRLLDYVDAACPHRLPHPSSPTGSVEKLAPEEVKPQIPHHGKDRRRGDSIRGEMLELDAVVVEEHHNEAARRRPEPVAVELDEGDDVALQRAWLSVLRWWCDPLGPHRGSEGS